MASEQDPPRLLIVDDDPVVARAVGRRLLREGYAVSLAGSCQAARAAGAHFRAAVLDLDLADGSGADLADELLRQGNVRAVVFYTGSLDTRQRARAQHFGPVVDKTHGLDEILSCLEPPFAAPPISHKAPSARTRQRRASARSAAAAPAPRTRRSRR
jgi:ActR/RegA family two-component response regulator